MGFSEPFEIFEKWFIEAENNEPELPNAMALATATAGGLPSSRMVLLKDWDENGFVFYTNLESRKAHELVENPNVALLFHWKSINRQIRIEGTVQQVDDAEADAYFASRDRGSKIGAWASAQSSVLAGRFSLEKAVAKYTAKFHVGSVPRPPHWSGYRVRASDFEFWLQKPFRLHERRKFKLNKEGTDWQTELLYP